MICPSNQRAGPLMMKERVTCFMFFIANHSVLAAKGGKKASSQATKKEEKIAVEKPLIPQEEAEFNTYITSYRNGAYYEYDPYSYYEIENEMLPQRIPQPKKPSLF